MLGYSFFKIIHLSSLLILSGLVLTSCSDKKISRWKWLLIFSMIGILGFSGFLLMANLGFISTYWPFWITLKIVGFVLMVIIALLGLKKLWSEKVIFNLWLIFSIAMVVISIKKFYY